MAVVHDAELEAVAESLRVGHSLPARWYADPDVLAHEQERIFRRSWAYAGRLDEVAEPGSYVAGSSLAEGPDRRGSRSGVTSWLRSLVASCGRVPAWCPSGTAGDQTKRRRGCRRPRTASGACGGP
jgi:hypothetical protein